MPDWAKPRRQEWIAALNDAIGDAAQPPLLVAHDFGALAVVHWASSHTRRVAAAMLVAPLDTDAPAFPAEMRSFHPLPRRRLGFPSVLVASSDDPYCSIQRAQELANAWGSRFEDVGPCGHINEIFGFGPWPDGEEILKTLMTPSS
jgi:predicted alpha/beta hydrolase family esterase